MLYKGEIMRKNIEKMYILNSGREYKMNVIVCTQNENLKKIVQKQQTTGDVDIFFSDDLDIEIRAYDLVIVDISLCEGRLDVAKMQSNVTVFLMLDIAEQNVDKVMYDFGTGEYPFTYSFSGKEHTVDLNDIAYFESCHKIVRGYNEEGAFIRFYDKLDQVQKKVDDFVFFLRVNKSYLVNYNYCSIEKDVVKISGKEIKISRSYKKELMRRLDIIKSM